MVPVPAPAIGLATAAPAAPWAPAVKVPAEAATPTTLQQRGEAIFDLAVGFKFLPALTHLAVYFYREEFGVACPPALTIGT